MSKEIINAYYYQSQVLKEFKNDIVGFKSNKTGLCLLMFWEYGILFLKLAQYLYSQKIVYVDENPLKIKHSSYHLSFKFTEISCI